MSLAILTVAVLMLSGVALRQACRPLRRLFIPSSVVAGFVGLILVSSLGRFGNADLVETTSTVQRLSSTSMEVLVVAAITSLKLSEVVALIGPFAILFVCGAAWTGVCLMVISRWVLPREHWFELALINYGMSTGTTATGFVLLRAVDPDLKTNAASDYAMAAPLSAPFIGGGIVTFALPLVLLERVSIVWPVVAILVVVATLILVGRRLGKST
ncbi:MAG: hypothetical protein KDB00_02790 [Planctomycetales bacterium]|nr:hypothetical protein [Planctomycetales bacterium]